MKIPCEGKILEYLLFVEGGLEGSGFLHLFPACSSLKFSYYQDELVGLEPPPPP